MVWVFLELTVALLLAVFIVWFTMGGKSKERPQRRATPAVGDDVVDKHEEQR